MSNLSNVSKKQPGDDPQHNRARKSVTPCLQQKYKQKSQVDNLLTNSPPVPNQALNVGPPTSIAHTTASLMHKRRFCIRLYLFMSDICAYVKVFAKKNYLHGITLLK